MAESGVGEVRTRISIATLYGIVAAFEIWGYRSVLAGRNILVLPAWWKYAAAVFSVWICWTVFLRKREKRGFVQALASAGADGFGLIGFFRVLVKTFVGPKILEPPSTAIMCVYIFLVALLLSTFYRKDFGKAYSFNSSDRIATAMMVLLFLTKIAMVLATGHQPLMLKGVGCIAVSIGMLFMILGVLNAESSGESGLPATPGSFATLSGEEHPIV